MTYYGDMMTSKNDAAMFFLNSNFGNRGPRAEDNQDPSFKLLHYILLSPGTPPLK